MVHRNHFFAEAAQTQFFLPLIQLIDSIANLLSTSSHHSYVEVGDGVVVGVVVGAGAVMSTSA